MDKFQPPHLKGLNVNHNSNGNRLYKSWGQQPSQLFVGQTIKQ